MNLYPANKDLFAISFILYTYLLILTYPDWATIPRFLRVGLFMAVFRLFFHIGRSLMTSESIFHSFKSSFIVSIHVFRGRPFPLKPSTSRWKQLLIQFSLRTTWPYHLRWYATEDLLKEFYLQVSLFLSCWIIH